VTSCSDVPLKASRKKSSKKSQGTPDETTSSGVHPAKTKSLESTKRKSGTSEQISDVKLQEASNLAQLSRKKAKKAIKKVVSSEVRRVPSAFDDDLFVEPSQKGFFFWPFLRFYFPDQRTPSSENEFVDIGSFSDVADEAATKAELPAVPQPVHPQEEVSPEFTRDLELTIHKGEEPVQDVALLETREDLPEGQDPSPFVAAFNKSFGTSHRGELLSVDCEVARSKGGAPRILTLWKSSSIIDET
jgi:hypothetical protein